MSRNKQQAKLPFDPVPCRDDFASLAQSHFHKTGVAVEVGVFEGEFAAKNLHKWQGDYYMVDAWKFRPGDPTDKNFADEETNDAIKKKAEHATQFAAGRRHLVQALSQDAAKTFADGSIDWMFLDALHTREAVLEDLAAWYPKLRPGGLLTGDDYGDKEDTQMVTAERWAKHYGEVARHPNNNWGVMSALHQFAEAHNLDVHVTWLSDCYRYNAWYIMKPTSSNES